MLLYRESNMSDVVARPSDPNGYALHYHSQANNGFQLGVWCRSRYGQRWF